MAILVYDNRPVGVDIEYINKTRAILGDNRLSKEQNQRIAESKNPNTQFFIE